MARHGTISPFLLAFVALAGFPGASLAQSERGLDPALRTTQYVHETWSAEEGLPQNSVSALAQTPDGYLWIGTQEGLARFDGVRFVVFDPDNEPALLTADIIDLEVDDSGTLWIAVRRGGLVSYQDGHFRHHPEVPLSATAVSVGSGRTRWVGTFGAGLAVMEGDSVRVLYEKAGFGGRFSGSAVSHEGTTYVATDSGLLILENGIFREASFDETRGAWITTLHVDPDNALWVATRDERLFRMRDGSVEDHTNWLVASGGYVRSMLHDRAGSLWLSQASGGVTRVAHNGIDRFAAQEGLSDNQVLKLLEDREGALWIGTAGGGLNRLRPPMFVPFTTEEGLPHPNTYSVLTDRQGVTWVGTELGVVGIEANRIRTSIGAAQGLAHPHVLSLAETGDGGLWLGTADGGLYRWHPQRPIQRFSTETGLTGDAVFALFKASDGVLWIGTDAGVDTFADGAWGSITTDDGLSSPFPTYFAEDRRGVWVGTYDGGLNHVVGGRVARIITTDDGLPENGILSLLVDDKDRVWAGTYGGGLAVIEGDSVGVLDRSMGLFNNTVMALVDDHQGRLWMSSNRGVYWVDAERALDAAFGRAAGVVSTVYDMRDGLASREAAGGQQPSGWVDPSGTVWFPTTNGVASVRSSDVGVPPSPPMVIVESLRVDGKRVSMGGTVHLEPGSDRLDFSYTATALSNPSRVEFAFQMMGRDAGWIRAGSRREATYTSLKPGTYEFRVFTSDADGLGSDNGTSIRFTLAPHFWETRWFTALCVLLALGALVGLYALRMARHRLRAEMLERTVRERTRELREEKERVEQAKSVIEAQAAKLRELDHFKTRFFSNVSHEFRTPLTMIIGPLENALAGRYGKVGEKVSRQMDIMLRNALRLMRLINQLLDLSKLEAGKMQFRAGARNLVGFLKDVMLTIHPFAEKKGLELSVTSSSDRIEVYYEPDKLEKVFYNLLSNAAKFTPKGGRLSIEIDERSGCTDWPEGSVLVRVSDTGNGIPADALPHIFDRFHQVDGSNTRQHEGTGIGLSLVREMVALHGGTVEVESEVGSGTTFTIVFPKGRAHLKDDQIVLTGTVEYEAPHLSRTTSSEFGGGDSEAANDVVLEKAPAHAPTVLVIDDNADVRDYVGSIISHRYKVRYAVDGVDGLEEIGKDPPSLILCDVQMPRMDGTTLCRTVKEDPALRHIPLILVSARATQQTKMEGLNTGADDYVPKPFNADELLARIGNLLKLREHERQLAELNEHLEDKVEEQLGTILSERERYETELIEERDRAQAAARLKTTILDNMNHEFRTPLSIILGSVQIIRDESSGDLETFAADIEQGANRLLSTLEAVSEMSSLAAGVEVNCQSFDPVAEARRAVDRHTARVHESELTLRVHAPTEPIRVDSDAASYARVLDILLDNAVKFTECGEITVDFRRIGNRLLTSVRDTGIGVAEAHRPAIFEAFGQGSEGLARTHEGFGLGLTIGRQRAELLGGELSLESSSPRGSVFTLAIPVEPAAKPKRQAS